MASTTFPFLNVAIAAFPPSCQMLAEDAAEALTPFIERYFQPPIEAVVLGKSVQIPQRIYFLGLDAANLQSRSNFGTATLCLCTRSTDGHLRQTALRHILGISQPWVIPFITLLAGGYVIEIIEDMVASLPLLDHGAYRVFVRDNRAMMSRLRSQATSYWNCNYRHTYPDRNTYPGLIFLYHLEVWAS